MKNNREKIYYVIFILIIIALFVLAYFLFDKLILGNSKKEDAKYKESITTTDVLTKMNNSGLSKYDLSKVIQANNKNANYIFRDTNDNYEIIYVDFKELSLATNNFTTNLNLLKGKYKNLTDITNINEEKYSKYEAENKTNYVILLKIGTGYFQVETTKNNKANIQKIISNIEG